MIASLPHFFKAEQLLDGIASGLRPNKTAHGIRILLETVRVCMFIPNKILKILIAFAFRSSPTKQITGTPLSAAKRLQFSLEVKPIPEVEWMKNMPDVILPIFWVEESAHLGKPYTTKLKASLFSLVFLAFFFAEY